METILTILIGTICLLILRGYLINLKQLATNNEYKQIKYAIKLRKNANVMLVIFLVLVVLLIVNYIT
jgi:hypothetical protein